MLRRLAWFLDRHASTLVDAGLLVGAAVLAWWALS
jgi:hypothetical protein